MSAQPGPALIAETFADFVGRHRGETIIVCGCGPSLQDFPIRPAYITIGVNDVGRRFDPDYLVVVNPSTQFAPDRLRAITESRARAVFTQYTDWRLQHASRVTIALGSYGGVDFSNPNVLHYTGNSPYVALCLAVHMGAARIGLIGVDFTSDHFFGATGVHPLAGSLNQIDGEYARLRDACAARGVEVVNLSPISRLAAFPRMQLAKFLEAGSQARAADESLCANLRSSTPVGGAPAAADRAPDANARREANQRVFFVHHRFITCGDVLTDGLRHAAEELALQSGHAYWDDPQLPEKVSRFAPDLLWVVNGRMLVRRWGARFREYRSAVWLVDEPYEVDDTANYSHHFSSVFINDPSTLTRHRNSYYLPLCYDPRVHFSGSGARQYRVGFVGAANPTRERSLVGLAERGLLSYVVGGPWSDSRLRALCLAPNIPAAKTAELYRDTDIVVNVFRDQHQFNHACVAGTSMNPRIYEALACGALVVSERRAEVAQVFPTLPQFETPDQLLSIVRRLLADPTELATLRTDCRARCASHTYGDRLQRVIDITLKTQPPTSAMLVPSTPVRPDAPPPQLSHHSAPAELPPRAQPSSAPPEPGPPHTAPSCCKEPLMLPPLATTPRRHLLYHLWPVRGGNWRWNVEQLLQRVDLFNGRRICAIVSDERTEDRAAVGAVFDGHGFEFVEMANALLGEAATFPRLLEMVEGEGAGDVSFYAHAKGVKYEPTFPPAVQRWAEVQYAVNLDHWVPVREHLDRFAMTGVLRRLGRVANHRNVGDWHYSGTFFWFRHDAVFGARRREVPQFYGGVEAWPGTMFSQYETGCLLLDNQSEPAYQETFWTKVGNPAFAQWKQSQRTVPVPFDLAQPLPFEGHAGPRLEQRPEEFAWWLGHLLERRVKRILIIGAGYGGDEWHLARRFREAGVDIRITALCTTPRPEWAEAMDDARARFGQVVQHEANREALRNTYEAVFIDGDHGWRACMSDVELALSLQPQLIGLHDIVDSDWHAQNRCAVSRVWASLQRGHAAQSCVPNAQWGGIGIIGGSAAKSKSIAVIDPMTNEPPSTDECERRVARAVAYAGQGGMPDERLALVRSSPLFDSDWYLARYPDVAAAGIDPVEHFINFGATEGRDPGPAFHTRSYLRRYPDVADAGINPLVHYLGVGLAEGRDPTDGGLALEPYAGWVREYDTLGDADRKAIGKHMAELSCRPLISVIVPVYNTPERYLKEAIESVVRQLYPHWELCIADDASTQPHVREMLEKYRQQDSRVKVTYRQENGHISAATNSAIEMATGEFAVLLDHDDLLPEHALYEIAVEIEDCPEADVIYSDSDNIDDSGQRRAPYFKTDWDPDLMLGHNLVNHLGAYRRSLLTKIGGLRQGFEGSQDYDLILRAADASHPDRIRHIPAILYHWRRNASSPTFSETDMPRCIEAARRAITEHLMRKGTPARLETAPGLPLFTRVVYSPPSEWPLVSVIVPTRDRCDLLRRCADGVLNRTAYARLELLIVDNDSAEPETRREFNILARDPRVRIIHHPGAFNYAAMNNHAVTEARGEIIVLLNNDVEVTSPNWLEEMVTQALRPEVGAVGAKLLYPDGKVQHAGIVLGVRPDGDGPGHFFYHARGDDIGHFGLLRLTRRVSAVTAACMALRRSVYEDAGGLDDVNLPVAYNDVDLCLRIRAGGYAVIWTPHAELVHHESATRGYDKDDERRARLESELQSLRRRWRELLDRDPYYNQNCDLIDGAFFQPGFPPRRTKPWSSFKEPSMKKATMSRADILLAPIDRSARILEIGPSFSPIAAKADGWNARTLDHTTRDKLIEKYTGHPVDVSRIEEVDFVWTGGPIEYAVPHDLHGTFDAFIASHVIEHTTDIVGFLSSASTLLSKDGIVILAIPDKRYCFDYFRPLTTTGEVLYAHDAQRSRHTRRIVFDHIAYATMNGGTGAWGQAPVATLNFFHTLKHASEAFSTVSEDPSGPYVDMHAWQFTPSSFELLILELAHLGKTDWRVESVTPATGCEFYAWLRRGGIAAAGALSESELDVQRLALLKRTLLETREQIDFLLAGDSALRAN